MIPHNDVEVAYKGEKSYRVYLLIYSGNWPYLIQLRLFKTLAVGH